MSGLLAVVCAGSPAAAPAGGRERPRAAILRGIALHGRAGHQATVGIVLGRAARCRITARRGRVVHGMSTASSGEPIRLTWRIPVHVRPGTYLLSADCVHPGSRRHVRQRIHYVVSGRGGHRFLWSPRHVFVDLIPAVTEGLGGGGNAIFMNPDAYHQCVWWADQMRPDIWQAATNHNVPQQGYANPISLDAWWDAWRWAANAARGGLPEGHVAVVGSIVVFPKTVRSPRGHVAYVDRVNADGSYHVTEYNRDHVLRWGQRDLPAPSAGDGLVFIYGGIAGTPSFATVNGPPQCTALQGGCAGPIQGSSPPIQGSSPPIQGSTPPIQGGGGGSGGGGSSGGGGGSTPPPPAPSISAGKGGVYGCSACHTLDVQVHAFPTGTFTYYCHDNSGPGGSDIVFFSHAVAVTDPNQGVWPGVFCYDSAPYVAYLVMNGVRSNSVQF